MKNHSVNVSSSDPEQSWARARDNLRTYRQAGIRDWGDIDEAAIARYVAGESDPAERRLVERAMRDFPRVRDCVDLLSVVTDAEVPAPVHVKVIEPDSRAISPRRRASVFRPRMSLLTVGLAASAAVMFMGLGVGFYALRWGTMKTPASLPSPAFTLVVAGREPAVVKPATDSGAGRPASPDRKPQMTGILVAQNVDRPANRAGEPRTPGETLVGSPAPVRATETGRAAVGGVDAKPVEVARLDEPTVEDEPEPEPEPMDIAGAKIQRNVPLDKLLEAPEQYSGRLVSLERTYCVRDVAERRPNGPVRLSLIETDLTLKNNVPMPRRFDQVELDVDRRLADRLIQIGKVRRYVDRFTGSPGWDDKPAIVTLMVSDRSPSKGDAACRVVGMEFFQDIEGEAMGKALKVRYTTRTVTPDGDTTGLGNAAEWSKTPKLGHLYQLGQRNFKRMRTAITNARAAEANRAFGAIMSQGLNKAVQDDAAASAERVRSTYKPLGR